MSRLIQVFTIMWLCLISSAVRAAGPEGLLAEWNFDEGKGDIAHDSSGHGHEAKVYGATWVKQGGGFAMSFDGLDDYINLTATRKLDITGPISIETWIKPMAKSQGLASVLGSGLGSYLLGYYAHAELCFWFIGSGGNKLYGRVNFQEWNHVAASFDGERMSLWLNGRQVGERESQIKTYKSLGGMTAGTKGRPDLPKFRGMMDKVRVYGRALSAEEVVAHFKGEAPGYGHDPTWFRRVKLTPYYYLDRGEVVIEADYTGLQPLEGKAQIDVTLSSKEQPQEVIQRQLIEKLPAVGVVEVRLPCGELTAGDYIVRVALQDGKGARPVEEFGFSYPAEPPPVPSPADKAVSPLPPTPEPTPFEFKMGKGGGFALTVKGTRYPFQSRISWPNGDFNSLTAGAEPYGKGEKSWKASVRPAGKDRYEVKAEGDFYAIQREIEVFPTHVYIRDTYTNATDEDLGLLIYNELHIGRERIIESRLGGFERGGRLTKVFSPSIFVDDGNTGIGFLPIDDVYVIQSVLYNEQDRMGMGTEKFALAPGKSYTLEWAVYPTGSGDFYDFINTFRTVEGRISTIDGGLGFFTHGPKNRDQIPEKNFIEKRGLKYGLMHNLAGIVDDPQLSIQGIEFMDFPKERERLRRQLTTIHEKYPDLKVLVHIAHSLYCTNNTDRFADSKMIRSNGEQAIWGVPHAYISKERQDKGWKFWIFYPTPGNSFHDALMKSVDVLMDDIGIDGGFMDGFFAGYGGRWTYDGRWDGHSAEIDLKTKTITRKIGSVLLLSQPSMIEYCRKIRDKGGAVVANNTVVTRSMANEKYIIHDSESGAGPQLHLAPNLTALGHSRQAKTKKDVYLNTLENLRWGELFMYYGGHFNYTYQTLAARQFPMTFEEIRSGLVRGPERIVTMNSGVYGWPATRTAGKPGERDLHVVYKFDGRGVPASHDFVTTIDQRGVRTELKLGKHESAVIEPIPVVLNADAPVNTRVLRYDSAGLHILLNGQGPVVLQLRHGAFPVKAGDAYRVTAAGVKTTIAEKDGTVSVPLRLDGQVEVVIGRAVEVE